ncbi:MAG TPA: VCBS repeat-containing protein, partial [Chitinophagaceae bacterium]
HFANTLKPSRQFNMFNYMYFYNGAGIGAGDFNNDGLIDLFFAANQGDNKLYINKGSLKFEDRSVAARIPQDSGWSTGVSVVDINNDGLLDIYVCRVGNYETLHSRNQFLVCQGIGKDGTPFYKDEAASMGLDFSGFSTQAVFFDYDMDGDLDMFLLNHAVHQNGSFAPRGNFAGTYSALSGDRIYRNDSGHFTDVTRSTGINSSAISYGLGVTAADINLDGWPDLYVGNDFHENDYLYINRHNGTFSDEDSLHLMHTSRYSMGVDVADGNNDGLPDILSMDMLPADPYILKRSLGDDDYDVFQQKIAAGYNYQYSRNNLQYNRGNGMFSEIGIYSGLYATDWSWACLWVDFDNDGRKDVFISNGIPKRLNDMDYVNFLSNEEVQEKLRENNLDDKNMALIKKFPQIKIPNKFFYNGGSFSFRDVSDSVVNDQSTYSNGAIYADLDNDGDLDVVVNNIDDPVVLYENKSNDSGRRAYVDVVLKGSSRNVNAIGAKLVEFSGGEVYTYENYPVHGFQSSLQIPMHVGLAGQHVDSMFLIWPDNTYQRVSVTGRRMSFTYQPGLPAFNYSMLTARSSSSTDAVTDITAQTGLLYDHQENSFIEFNREPLIPHMVSTEGPALAVGDINNDGLQDVFFGSSKTFHDAVFMQQAGGKFVRKEEPGMLADSMYEDVDAVWMDVNRDGHPDLVIASGGNEYFGQDEHLLPRVYLNDGQGNLTRKTDAFTNLFYTFSCVAPFDFNGDGADDIFLGGRAMPWDYGVIPHSFLLQNDGSGKFVDVTDKIAPGLSQVGMVTGASWTDLDGDGDSDLVVSCEWGGIVAFINEKGRFTKQTLTTLNGWWNFVLPIDIDNDGDVDLVAGNLGLNSRLKASIEQPVKLYYNDFDDNGKKDQVMSYFVNGKEVPFASEEELQKQIPRIKKKFLYAGDFARASMDEIFGEDKLKEATVLNADNFSNVVFINDGHLHFTPKPLPWQAQLSSYRDARVVDANHDGLPDILLGGNFYDNNVQMGRYDADFGTLLVNRGNDSFECTSLNGLAIRGQVRRIRPIRIGKDDAFVLARNNDSAMVIRFGKHR